MPTQQYYSDMFTVFVEKEGYKLLSEYKTAKTKVKLKCPKGHIYEVTPSSFKTGNRCSKCSNKCPIQAKEQFIELLTKEGYELIGEYKNTHTKVKLKCDRGHEWETIPNNFKKGNRCPKCSNICPIQAKEQFIQTLDQEGYELLSEYKNVMIKVKIRCPEGHEYNVKPNDFKNDRRCPRCAGLCPEQAKEQLIRLLHEEGYELLSEYINTQVKIKLKCPEGHEYSVKPYSFKNNYARCPHCAGSTGQRLLQELLKEHIKEKVIYNDRKALNGLELDIYYPELNIGIEYQGNYWHSLPEHIERDKRKKKLCEELGIKLIEVWDNDFMKDHDIEINNIINIIQGVK